MSKITVSKTIGVEQQNKEVCIFFILCFSERRPHNPLVGSAMSLQNSFATRVFLCEYQCFIQTTGCLFALRKLGLMSLLLFSCRAVTRSCDRKVVSGSSGGSIWWDRGGSSQGTSCTGYF